MSLFAEHTNQQRLSHGTHGTEAPRVTGTSPSCSDVLSPQESARLRAACSSRGEVNGSPALTVSQLFPGLASPEGLPGTGLGTLGR